MKWVNKLPKKETPLTWGTILFFLIIFLIGFGLYLLAIHRPDIVNSLMVDPAIPELPYRP